MMTSLGFIKRHYKAFLLFLGTCIVLFSFAFNSIVIPWYDKQYGMKSKNIQAVADKDVEAFVWDPGNGNYGSMPHWEINKTYAKQYLKDNIKWRLQASVNNATWYNADELLKIGLNWNNVTCSYKVTLTLNTTNAPQSLYYRFDLACNKSLKDYAVVNGYEWRLRLPANNTKDFTLVFNWSDIKPLIQSGKVFATKGVTSNFFWFRIQTVNKIAVGTVFVVDPSYGLIANAVLDTYEWDGTQGIYPDMVRVNNSQYYLIAGGMTDNDGWVKTVKVWSDNGTIQKSIVSSFEYDISDGGYPSILKVPGTDKYAIVYRDPGSTLCKVVTLQVWANNGTIRNSVIDTQSLTQYSNYRTAIVNLPGTQIYAIAYRESTTYDGWIETINIAPNGQITGVNDSIEFNPYDAYYPSMVALDSDTVCIVYRSTGTDGWMICYNISGITGDITNANASWWEFDTNTGDDPNIINVYGNVYAIAYQGAGNDGFLKTITIATTGAITKSWIDTLDFCTATSYKHYLFWVNGLTQTNNGVIGISLLNATPAPDAQLIRTMNISRDGTIGNAIIDSLTVSADAGWTMPIVYVNKSWYYGVHFLLADNDGWSFTVQIDTNWASSTFSNPSPANNSVDQALTPQCAITVNDLNGDAMTVNFYENSTGSWVLRQTNSSCANGTYRWTFAQASSYSLKYYWKVYINDGTHNVSNWYCFTTLAPPDQEPTWQSLFNSTLTFGNTTTGNKSLFTSLLTFGNTTTTYKSLFTSTLTFGNTTTGHDSLFTSTLSFGNISATTSLFTSTLTFGNITSDKSLFTSLLSFGNTTTKYASLFTSTLTFGNISSGTWTSLFTSNLSFGNISSNHSFFTSLLSFGNETTPHSLFTSLLTFGNTSVLSPATPYNMNLLVINPNPGNGTHNTNYLKSNASGLTTSIDVFYENFTTPAAYMPGTYSMTIIGTTPANTPVLWNASAVYATVHDTPNGIITPGNPYVGQYYLNPNYDIFRSFLMFDTSVIPDEATVTGAYVQLVVFDDYSDDDFNVTLQETKSPVPHDPLIIGDYFKNGFSGHFGHTNTTGYADEDIFNIILNPLGAAFIKKTSSTAYGLRSDQDINSSAPTGDEFVIFYGYGVATAKYPKLIVNFTIPNSNWEHFVNLTWYSNSSGAWTQYNKSYVNSNGTITVPALNFSGVDSYFWHLEWESNHTNNGSSQVYTFTTVNAGSGHAVFIGDRDRFNMGFIIGATFFFILGMILWKKKRKGS